ncbi:MAG: histidinol-phosphate aminotransferase family protein [Desulfurococcales archaeon]|nr:histidinol-phosphate aminotransferase family protein [Desulfurococcales archaeon]
MIILSRNECPFPPSPSVKRRVADCISRINRYGDPEISSDFMRSLSDYVGLPADHITPLPGSEAFFLYLSDYLRTREFPFKYSSPTFVPAVEDLRLRGVPLKDIPLTKDFRLNLGSLTADGGGVLYVVNPNNPTGNAVAECGDVEELLSHFDLVILDEAYFEFSGKTCIDLVGRHENIVILRTFSKAFCIAGARLGYVIGQPRTLSEILSSRRLYDIPIPSLAAGLGALEDIEYVRDVVKTITRIKDDFVREVKTLVGWEIVETETNFLLLRREGMSSADLYRALKERGYEVKPLNGRLNHYVRVSVGKHEEMKGLLQVLRELTPP